MFTFALASEMKSGILWINNRKSEMIMETGEKDKIIEKREDTQDEKNVSSEELNLDLYDTEELNLDEENASESEVSVTKNYSFLSRQNLLNELKTLVDNFPVERIRKDVEAIKEAFYKDRGDFSGSNDEGEGEDDGLNDEHIADPVEEEFEKYLDEYKNKRYEYVRIVESQREENYKQKLAIIEELRELIKEEEDLNLTFQKFHDLQNRWREVAQVPQNHIKDLWDTWHYNVEKFYDYVKINKELRDLDLKRNLEAKNELVRKAEALLESPSIVEAFTQLQQYHDAWREIGPVPREQRDEIWERFKEASYKLNRKHQAYFEQLKRERQQNLQMKIDLCERLEKLNQKELKTLKEWQKASDELTNILDEWRAIGFVPKKENNEIYARLKKSRDEFFNKRRSYYKAQKHEATNSFRLKKELCEKARLLKDSENWKETTDLLIEMQKQWQQIGRAPRKYENSLWSEFRESCDAFFNRKAEHFAKKSSSGDNYGANLRAKEALIAELENFVPTGNNAKTVEMLKQFRQRWNEIGFVPIKEKEKIHSRFFTLMDEKFKQLKDSEPQRKGSWAKDKKDKAEQTDRRDQTDRYKDRKEKTDKPDISAGRPENLVQSKREKLFNRIMQLESEVTLLENNIGFFASSKNADKMVAGFRKQISRTREVIRKMEEQIKVIDKEFE
ncbi:MAG: DUF349 domain-containing protein [Prevotellaceae bacterium]|jgi:hypothetical protein|nr:DUF349 domain-containing protein [Prevotellaceae bacterium]